MSRKKPYAPPTARRHSADSPLEGIQGEIIRQLQQEARAVSIDRGLVESDCFTLIDMDRRYVEVSDSFCELVDYEREALIGKRYDELTASGTNDVHTIFNLFCQLEYMHGLWMLVSRTGALILVRYESWLRPDQLIEGHMQPVRFGS